MPLLQPSTIPTLFATLNSKLRELFDDFTALPHPELVLELERSIHALARWWADCVFACWLDFVLERTDFQARVTAARRARSDRKLRHKGRRRVELKLLGGHCVMLRVVELHAQRRAGRARGHGRRGRGKGHERTPSLQALGFVRRCSPALAAHELELSASCSSFDAARSSARRRGIARCQDTWLSEFEQFSSLTQRALHSWLDEPGADSPLGGLSAAGRTIALGFDGGRLRERVDRRGRKKSNGYRDFEAPWVEPRQFVALALDEHGKQDKQWGKLAHASLEPGKRMFATLTKLLKSIEIEKAERVVLMADGQHWQWVELRKMLVEAGVDPGKIVEVLDKCHALGRLAEISHKPAKWGPRTGARVRFYHRGKQLLESGEVDGLVSHCMSLARGSRRKPVKSLTSYFEKHRERMRYAEFAARGIPTGSGAVESMIRQVVNARLKGCGKFWKRENAERMLLVRSWWVTGRLEDLWRFALRRRASWWKPAQEQNSCGFDYAALFS